VPVKRLVKLGDITLQLMCSLARNSQPLVCSSAHIDQSGVCLWVTASARPTSGNFGKIAARRHAYRLHDFFYTLQFYFNEKFNLLNSTAVALRQVSPLQNNPAFFAVTSQRCWQSTTRTGRPIVLLWEIAAVHLTIRGRCPSPQPPVSTAV